MKRGDRSGDVKTGDPPQEGLEQSVRRPQERPGQREKRRGPGEGLGWDPGAESRTPRERQGQQV